ncbi:MAG: cell division protein SepF [Hungatella sp.]|nr:cell division protein SepF [Hungatella sp.]
MSLFGRIMESMRLSDGDDDDYFLDDDYEEEDERPPRKSLFGKRDEEYYDDEEEEEEAPRPRFLGRSSNNSSNKVVPMKRNMEVSLVIPTSFGDSKELCDHLLAGKTVLLNMEGLHTEVAQRIIDFASGAVYSINGNLQKISNYIFIVTPDNVDLSGDFQDILGNVGMGANNGPLDISGLNLRL